MTLHVYLMNSFHDRLVKVPLLSDSQAIDYLIEGVTHHLTTGNTPDDYYEWIDPQFSENEPSKVLMVIHQDLIKQMSKVIDLDLFKGQTLDIIVREEYTSIKVEST